MDANGNAAEVETDGTDPPWLEARTGEVTHHDVVVLPESVTGSMGEYTVEVDSLVKLLRAEGVDAAFLHEAAEREWRARHGITEVAFALSVAASLVGSATWTAFTAGLKAWIGSASVRSLRLRLRVRNGEVRRLTISGESGAVIEALSKLPDIISRGHQSPPP